MRRDLFLDCQLQLIVIHQADETFHDFPVARNQHAGGQANQAAEFFGNIIVAA